MQQRKSFSSIAAFAPAETVAFLDPTTTTTTSLEPTEQKQEEGSDAKLNNHIHKNYVTRTTDDVSVLRFNVKSYDTIVSYTLLNSIVTDWAIL